MYVSLRFASDSKACISYINTTNNTLDYAAVILPTGATNIETISGSVLYSDALALHAGIPYVAYYTTSYDLKFARRVGDGSGNCGNANDWLCEVVDSTGRVGEHVLLQINSAGMAFISYYDSTMGDLILARMTLPFFLPLITGP